MAALEPGADRLFQNWNLILRVVAATVDDEDAAPACPAARDDEAGDAFLGQRYRADDLAQKQLFVGYARLWAADRRRCGRGDRGRRVGSRFGRLGGERAQPLERPVERLFVAPRHFSVKLSESQNRSPHFG